VGITKVKAIILLVLSLTIQSSLATADSDPHATAFSALEEARSLVTKAAELGSLWILAKENLEKAEKSFANGDYAETLEFSSDASTFAKLGIEQENSPPYEHR
jgi:hypothetical protein